MVLFKPKNPEALALRVKNQEYVVRGVRAYCEFDQTGEVDSKRCRPITSCKPPLVLEVKNHEFDAYLSICFNSKRAKFNSGGHVATDKQFPAKFRY